MIPSLLLPADERPTNPRIGPIVRFLGSHCSYPVLCQDPEAAICALEEALRVDHSDPLYFRETLLFGYLKMVGRRRLRRPQPVRRTVEHVRALLDCHFAECEFPLFRKEPSTPEWYNEDLMAQRWAAILLAYDAGDDAWKELVIAENGVCPYMVPVLLSTQLEKEMMPETDRDQVTENAARFSDKLHCCVLDWCDFVGDLHLLIKGTRTDRYALYAGRAPPHFAEQTRDQKHKMAESSEVGLPEARAALTAGNYALALTAFTLARRQYCEIRKPSHRWYVNAPFHIVSNRALCAERLGCWNLCRHDTRETLFLKPDHWRSYERLPLICEKFEALELKEEMTRWVAGLNRKMAPGDWVKAAANAIALISITGLMESKKGTLTHEKRTELIRIGIDDCFGPMHFGPDVMDPLPWLENQDLEWT
jgi:hypothetical protein